MYINEFTDNNIVYSIDMIRLKAYITYSTFTEIEFRFKTCWSKYVKKFYTSPHQQQFFYNYNIEVGDNQSFWFGFCHNTERRSFSEKAEYNFTIEFNPNKLKDNKIIKYLLSLSGEWFLKSYDIALDLKVNILDLIIDTSGRHTFKMLSNGYDDRTYYYGKGDGRVKIYNKKKQSNLSVNYELTRVEVSRELEDFPISNVKNLEYDCNFPLLYLNDYVYSLSDYDDKTLLALLYSVQSGYPLKELTRRYREKIRNMFEGGHKIRFTSKIVTQCLRKTIFYYFIDNPLVKWK